MSEYTPTTEHVRAQYARQENYDDYYEGDLYLTPDGQLSAQEFDRWLAQHDAEVAEETLNKVIMLLKSEPEETKGLRRALQIVSLLATRQGPRDET